VCNSVGGVWGGMCRAVCRVEVSRGCSSTGGVQARSGESQVDVEAWQGRKAVCSGAMRAAAAKWQVVGGRGS